MADTISNKVAESGLVTLDPAAYLPSGDTAVFDMKDHLFMGLILKEKDFRDTLKKMDWEQYRDKDVALTCSADAIVPVWAYMLVTANLQPIARNIIMGDIEQLQKQMFLNNISSIDISQFADQRIVIKGCGDIPIGDFAYMELTKILRPVARSIMYGEPCSTVPVFKRV